MEVTILQVSDLHRDPTHPLSNSALLTSMQRDHERWREEVPTIPQPNLVLVCGDLVQGVAPDSLNHRQELESQYREAEQFLVGIADHFVDGDRGRVIIVPGNHDVDSAQTTSSLKRLVAAEGVNENTMTAMRHYRAISRPHSTLRWSWKDLSFYEIKDKMLYEARLEPFCAFYGSFYQRRRTYSLTPADQYDIFDYPTFNLTIVGFNSCYNNDPLNKTACIHADCISKAAAALRDRQYRNRLRIALWHHNVNGSPFRSDYLDADTLQVMIDYGFSLGLHGHQHKPQFIEERFQFGRKHWITVIAAGTLCGGPDGLPGGQSRGYNVLTIDTEQFSGVLHQRHMLNEGLDTPIWGPGVFPLTQKSFVDFPIRQPLVAVQQHDIVVDLGEAEQRIRLKQYTQAVELLLPILPVNLLARRLLLECYVALDATPEITQHFYPPISSGEVVHVADALWTEKDVARLQSLLQSPIVQESNDPAVVEVRTKYSGRIA